jgi:hypothetical protein
MEIADEVIKHWRSQDIMIEVKEYEEIKKTIGDKNIVLPRDFMDFYQRANGMVNLFPNDYDGEGFLFYPTEELITMEIEFPNKTVDDLKNVIIFADYLLECWWYGIRNKEDGSYEIGLISDHKSFNFITASLSDFLTLYVADSEKLYFNPPPC